MCQSSDCNVHEDDLDAYHWLKNKERVIVKFYRRKDCEKVLKAQNDILELYSVLVQVRFGTSKTKLDI